MSGPIGLHTTPPHFIHESPHLPFQPYVLSPALPSSCYISVLCVTPRSHASLSISSLLFLLYHILSSHYFVNKSSLSLKTQSKYNALLSKINSFSSSTLIECLADTSFIAINKLYCPYLHISPFTHELFSKSYLF